MAKVAMNENWGDLVHNLFRVCCSCLLLLAAAKPKAHFQGFLELWSVITGHYGLKTGQKHLFEHPKGSRNKFGKNNFGPFLDPQMTHVTLP